MIRSEWMILIGLTLVILSILVPSYVAFRAYSLEKEVRRNIIILLTAGEEYYQDYGHWPTQYTGEFGDYRYGNTLSNVEVINILRAKAAEGNPDHKFNEKQKTYVDFTFAKSGESGLNSDQAFIDPWGSEYQIALDTDLNNTTSINRSTYKPQIGLGFLVWSYGPDRKSGSADDILSWNL